MSTSLKIKRGLIILVAIVSTAACFAKDIQFAGHIWTIRPNGTGGPGPCHWSDTNAWVDPSGNLHLKITHIGDTWNCAEIYTKTNLGFGTYQWQVVGRLDQLDKNVVLGLFPYRGPDGQDEIDIEMAHWGDPQIDLGSFTVYPAKAGVPHTSRFFPVQLNGDYTTHRFNWQRDYVYYQMLHGHQSGNSNEIIHWKFAPKNPQDAIPQSPMPLHMNLWLFRGRPPSDNREVEVIVKAFAYHP